MNESSRVELCVYECVCVKYEMPSGVIAKDEPLLERARLPWD